ncbi:MAG: MarR family winged helix-turn-helix transcriptional regulator, partial [Clostridia bacterium]|nr:MarR family winged helix-turn-helix transcriptional regulator [Clostridia bacterium]
IIRRPDCTQALLAEQLRVTPASIALSTKRLEKAGLIERRVDPDNRRCNRLRSTDEGAHAADTYRQCFNAVDSRTFRGFSEEERAQLASYLDRMIKNIAGSDTVPLFPFCKEDIHP